MDKVPDSFLTTVESINGFAQALAKVKNGAEADANVELTRDDCLYLIWGFQMLREGRDG